METVLRVVVLYVLILIGLRILGKRDVSKLSPFDLVTLLLIPELVQQALIREDFSATNAVIALATLFSLVLATSIVTHMSERANQLVQSTPTVLVSHGELVQDAMNRERVAPSEVYAEMHKAGLYHIGQVRWAILETDGKISFVAGADGSDHPGREPDASQAAM